MIGLTWRADNRLAMSWENGGDHGLTPLGEAAVRKMIELGVLVDVSHMNDASIRGVLDIAAQMKAPVVASHSNCRALCNHPRNLPDDLIKRIADSGGVIGVNFYSPFLRAGGAAAIADVVRHLAHLRDVGGIGCAALGTDYDGLESRQPAELKTAAGLVRLRQSLKQAGFSDVDIAAIFGGNFVRALTLAENRAGEIAIRAHGATPAGR
jgi:membrane dipeptidase